MEKIHLGSADLLLNAAVRVGLLISLLLSGCNPTSIDQSVQQRLIGDWQDEGNQVLRFYTNGTYEGRIGSYGPWMKGQYFVTTRRLRLKELEGEGPFPPTDRTFGCEVKVDTFELRDGKTSTFKRIKNHAP